MNAHTTIYVDESRYNLYAMIHKGLRRAQTEVLGRLGALDVADEAALTALLADLGALIVMGRQHLHHENEHIHGVIEALHAGATDRLADDHDHHLSDFDALETLMAALGAAPVASRGPLARALYLRYSQFLAEDFEHMLEEETETLSLLHQLFSDADLQAIEMAIIGSVEPAAMLGYLRIMIPAMNPAERIGMLGGMKAGMPAPIFASVIDAAVRPVLGRGDFARLASALGIAD